MYDYVIICICSVDSPSGSQVSCQPNFEIATPLPKAPLIPILGEGLFPLSTHTQEAAMVSSWSSSCPIVLLGRFALHSASLYLLYMLTIDRLICLQHAHS